MEHIIGVVNTRATRLAPWLLIVVAIGAIARADSPTGTGIVVIGCNEDDAEIVVDDVEIPDRTPAAVTLPVGTHVIEVRKPPLVAQKKVFEIADQQKVKLWFDLVPAAPPPPPPDAGSSPPPAPPPDAGSPPPDSSGSGAPAAPPAAGSAAQPAPAAAAGSAAPAAAGSNAAAEPLQPPPALAELEIATQASHALAYLDGAPMHPAPCVLEVEPGEHVVAVYAPGMVPAEQVVHLDAAQHQRVELTPSTTRERIDVPAP